MAMTFTASGFADGIRGVDTLASRIQHPDEKLLRRLGETVIEDIEERFMSAGRGTWPALAPATAKRKGSGAILIDSGAMFASLKMTLSSQSVDVSVPYGGRDHSGDVPGFHQTGTSRMPQRKIIENSYALRDALYRAARQWVSDMIAASFVRLS